jgi:hypothetical protein
LLQLLLLLLPSPLLPPLLLLYHAHRINHSRLRFPTVAIVAATFCLICRCIARPSPHQPPQTLTTATATAASAVAILGSGVIFSSSHAKLCGWHRTPRVGSGGSIRSRSIEVILLVQRGNHRRRRKVQRLGGGAAEANGDGLRKVVL